MRPPLHARYRKSLIWSPFTIVLVAANLAAFIATIALVLAVARALAGRRPWVRWGAAVASGLPLAYVSVLALAGFVNITLAVSAESVDPAQKARVLGEGIAQTMNCTALGGLLLIPTAVALVVLKRRRPRTDGTG